MIVTKVRNPQPTRQAVTVQTLAIGLFAGLLSASAAAGAPAVRGHAPGLLAIAQVASADPAKQVPGVVSVSAVDFKRGDGGAGKLILRFDGDGANPDLRTQGSNVIVNIGNATLPAALQRPLNVTDFATPVQRIDARQGGEGAQLVLSAQGNFESMAYQTGRDYVVEIVPRTSTAPDRAVGASSPEAVASTSQASAARTYSGRPVTFNFQDVPVRTVLQLIAEESNLNIVASDTVTGNVTLRATEFLFGLSYHLRAPDGGLSVFLEPSGYTGTVRTVLTTFQTKFDSDGSPVDLPKTMKFGAKLSHYALYGLMIVMPLLAANSMKLS